MTGATSSSAYSSSVVSVTPAAATTIPSDSGGLREPNIIGTLARRIYPRHVAAFTLAPIQLTPIFAIGVMYGVRARTLRDRGAPVPGWRIWCWYLGLALIIATLVSPIGQLSEELFLVHMTEHLLIADLGSLLLVLGLTGP